jgi:hypothetical protein
MQWLPSVHCNITNISSCYPEYIVILIGDVGNSRNCFLPVRRCYKTYVSHLTSAVFLSIRKDFSHVRYSCLCLVNWTRNKTMETVCQEK